MSKPSRRAATDQKQSTSRHIFPKRESKSIETYSMKYEVEQKHGVEDEAALIVRLQQHGAHLEKPFDQRDQYFAHPCRDFAKTDEALRVRVVGNKSFVT